jgi:putative glutamine amidotransferase
VETKGSEFGDQSISLSDCYSESVIRAGGAPLIAPATVERAVLARCVARCDGVLLTGGDDIEPRLYTSKLPASVRKTVVVCPDGGRRDLSELILLDEVFRQRKPLLAICRGHQLLNIALGGTLLADLAQQAPGAMKHNHFDRRNDSVHEVRLTEGCLLAKITGVRKLDVSSTHHQAVGRVAEPLTVTGASLDGVVEALELKPEASHWLPFLVSVQFHPERLAARQAKHRAIFSAFVRACGPG